MNQLLSTQGVTFLLLCAGAALEVLGDSCFQSGLHRSSGAGRVSWFLLGTVLLGLYALLVNLPRWDFGKLLGLYVVFFFLAAQAVAKIRFDQPMTMPVRVGGAFIVVGGLILSLWK